MKIVGFITEYNPFHFGHKYHLEESIRKTKATHSIALMSGSFVQRGEPSIVDKWTKATMAVKNGIDLVIELPFIYSVQSAELFAYGAISILNSLNIIDGICFGSELGELGPLMNIASLLNSEPKDYKNNLKNYLDKGYSYSEARSKAVEIYFSNEKISHDISNILKKSNNILGIEYLKAIMKLNSPIKPYAIQRIGDDYKNEHISNPIASATGIRKSIQENGLPSVRDYLPKESYNELEEFLNKYNTFNFLNNYNHIFQYLLRITTQNELLQIMDMENGLENRILSKGQLTTDIYELINKIQTRRYPKTRVQRILIHLLNRLYKETITDIYNTPPPYIRILASNNKGLEILNKIKEHTEIPTITKYADSKYIKDILIQKMLSFEEDATNLFYLGLNLDKPLVNMDYITSPYILK